MQSSSRNSSGRRRHRQGTWHCHKGSQHTAPAASPWDTAHLHSKYHQKNLQSQSYARQVVPFGHSLRKQVSTPQVIGGAPTGQSKESATTTKMKTFAKKAAGMQRHLMIGFRLDNAQCETGLIVDALAQVASRINGAWTIS
jgi:hypothetical protein